MAERTRKRRKKRDEPEEIDAQTLAALVNKEFGEGTVRFASDEYFDVDRIPTGVLSMDQVLGGGLPRGRHVEIFGPYAVGKTWLTYKAMASAQRMGLLCGFVDAEHTFDKAFAEMAGVDTSKLAIHKQVYGQKCIDLMELWISQGFGIVALDSIASLLPKEEAEAQMEAASMGMQQAKMMSKALRKLTAANEKTTIIFINQLRDNIGVTFGKRSTTTGGRAMGFYSAIRIEMSRSETIKRKAKVMNAKTGEEEKKDVVRGHRVLVRVEKGKVTGTSTGATTYFVFDYALGGADPAEDVIYLGRKCGVVHKRGDRWWAEGYEDEAQASRERFRRWLTKNVAVREEMELLIKEEANSAAV